MTVAELIEKLKALPPDAKVMCATSTYFDYEDVTNVELAEETGTVLVTA